ncbi:hypothetical protein FQZ97_1006190 [compost metagenome]
MVVHHLAAGDRAREDDRAAIAHERQRLGHAEEHRARVGGELHVVGVDGDRRRWLEDGRSCIRHIDVDGAEACLHRSEQAVVHRQVGHVADEAHRVRADAGQRCVHCVLAAPHDDDVGAFRRESLGVGQADAAVAAGDHGHLASEFLHDAFPCSTKREVFNLGCPRELQ